MTRGLGARCFTSRGDGPRAHSRASVTAGGGAGRCGAEGGSLRSLPRGPPNRLLPGCISVLLRRISTRPRDGHAPSAPTSSPVAPPRTDPLTIHAFPSPTPYQSYDPRPGSVTPTPVTPPLTRVTQLPPVTPLPPQLAAPPPLTPPTPQLPPTQVTPPAPACPTHTSHASPAPTLTYTNHDSPTPTPPTPVTPPAPAPTHASRDSPP